MPSSYRAINYSIRPAKAIERKMLVESFRKLAEFGSVDTYRYIGFGSPYFSDFTLVHRSLGITNMVSIEHSTHDKARFEFNRPFSCIVLEFGESGDVLARLSWNVRTILWLDYDGSLTADVLTDVALFCTMAIPGSMLVVSINAEPERLNGVDANRLERLRERVGIDKVPADVVERDLAGWGTAAVCVRIISNEIQEQLSLRNGGRGPGNKLLYREVFNFRYADGAKMSTVGGIIYDEGQAGHVAKCEFEKLAFFPVDGKPCYITVPNLTFREIRHLDAQLPCDDVAKVAACDIPAEDIRNYMRVYRYFPSFAETET